MSETEEGYLHVDVRVDHVFLDPVTTKFGSDRHKYDSDAEYGYDRWQVSARALTEDEGEDDPVVGPETPEEYDSREDALDAAKNWITTLLSSGVCDRETGLLSLSVNGNDVKIFSARDLPETPEVRLNSQGLDPEEATPVQPGSEMEAGLLFYDKGHDQELGERPLKGNLNWIDYACIQASERSDSLVFSVGLSDGKALTMTVKRINGEIRVEMPQENGHPQIEAHAKLIGNPEDRVAVLVDDDRQKIDWPKDPGLAGWEETITENEKL